MFPVGQMVYHRSGKHCGKVLECDGDTVYIVQTNGVELDFQSGELTPRLRMREVRRRPRPPLCRAS
jgi:hypothetical protein